ncbi:MAG: hypothetical protein ACOCXN_07840 [Spirochaetota bacterium]
MKKHASDSCFFSATFPPCFRSTENVSRVLDLSRVELEYSENGRFRGVTMPSGPNPRS